MNEIEKERIKKNKSMINYLKNFHIYIYIYIVLSLFVIRVFLISKVKGDYLVQVS